MFVPTHKLICDAEPGTIADQYVATQSCLLSCDNAGRFTTVVNGNVIDDNISPSWDTSSNVDDNSPYIREYMLEKILKLQDEISSYDFEMTDHILLVSELPLSVLNNGETTHDVVSVTVEGAGHIDDFLQCHHNVANYDELVNVENGNYNGFDVSKSPAAPSNLLSSYVLIPDDADEREYSSIEYHILRAITLMSWEIKRGDEAAREIQDTLNALIPALSKTADAKQNSNTNIVDNFLLRRRFSMVFGSLSRIMTLQERMSQALAVKRFNASLEEYRRWAPDLRNAASLIGTEE